VDKSFQENEFDSGLHYTHRAANNTEGNLLISAPSRLLRQVNSKGPQRLKYESLRERI